NLSSVYSNEHNAQRHIFPTRRSSVLDPNAPSKVGVAKGQQLASFGQLRADGSTMAGCWIYTGSWTEDGNMMARRDNSDPGGMGTDRKSTRLNSSHVKNSYAVFSLKKK